MSHSISSGVYSVELVRQARARRRRARAGAWRDMRVVLRQDACSRRSSVSGGHSPSAAEVHAASDGLARRALDEGVLAVALDVDDAHALARARRTADFAQAWGRSRERRPAASRPGPLAAATSSAALRRVAEHSTSPQVALGRQQPARRCSRSWRAGERLGQRAADDRGRVRRARARAAGHEGRRPGA